MWSAPGAGTSLGVGMQTLAGRGGAGKAGCAGKGWGALPEAWPGPRPGRVRAREAQGARPRDTCPVGVLTSRAQHLEQLEVLDAHLLLVPGQVGCGRSRRMSAASA